MVGFLGPPGRWAHEHQINLFGRWSRPRRRRVDFPYSHASLERVSHLVGARYLEERADIDVAEVMPGELPGRSSKRTSARVVGLTRGSPPGRRARLATGRSPGHARAADLHGRQLRLRRQDFSRRLSGTGRLARPAPASHRGQRVADHLALRRPARPREVTDVPEKGVQTFRNSEASLQHVASWRACHEASEFVDKTGVVVYF